MSTTIKNRDTHFSPGTIAQNENAYGLSLYKKVVVVEIDDMSDVTDGDVIYRFPVQSVVQCLTVLNYGTTAFACATSMAIDVAGATDLTDDVKVLAANAANTKYVEWADVVAAGTVIAWNLGGANSSLPTAKARVVIEFLTTEESNI